MSSKHPPGGPEGDHLVRAAPPFIARRPARSRGAWIPCSTPLRRLHSAPTAMPCSTPLRRRCRDGACEGRSRARRGRQGFNGGPRRRRRERPGPGRARGGPRASSGQVRSPLAQTRLHTRARRVVRVALAAARVPDDGSRRGSTPGPSPCRPGRLLGELVSRSTASMAARFGERHRLWRLRRHPTLSVPSGESTG